MVDMGIRLVVSEVEALANANIPKGDASTLASLPTFIEPIKDKLDEFQFNASTNSCVITHNINKLLVQNKTSASVLPFH